MRGDDPITIEAHLRIKEGVAEMVPGTTMDFWTFDSGIPGTMISGRVGDAVDFFLHNPEDSRMPHNVDFHARDRAGWRGGQAGHSTGSSK